MFNLSPQKSQMIDAIIECEHDILPVCWISWKYNYMNNTFRLVIERIM